MRFVQPFEGCGGTDSFREKAVCWSCMQLTSHSSEMPADAAFRLVEPLNQ
jgi:hypothetical protein